MGPRPREAFPARWVPARWAVALVTLAGAAWGAPGSGDGRAHGGHGAPPDRRCAYRYRAQGQWGHAVRPGREEDRWLLDALAEHALALRVEQRRGPTALVGFRERALAEAPPGATLASGGGGPAWRALKGVFVLEGLRALLRRPGTADPDGAWFGVLRELASTVALAGVSETFRALVPLHADLAATRWRVSATSSSSAPPPAW